MGSLWANGWNITQIIFIYLYPFLGTHLQVRPVVGFWRLMAQTTQTQARMCLLGFRPYYSLFRGQVALKTPILGTWIGIYSHSRQILKLPYFRNFYINCFQILHSDWDDQVLFVGPRAIPPYPVTSPPSSLFFYYFFLFSLSYSCFIYLLAFHPFPFYQNSPTPFPRPDVVGGDWTWL